MRTTAARKAFTEMYRSYPTPENYCGLLEEFDDAFVPSPDKHSLNCVLVTKDELGWLIQDHGEELERIWKRGKEK